MDLQLSEYKNFDEKKGFYQCNEVIDNEEDFDKKYADWIKQSECYAYRGVNEAKYKMFTSAQRKWNQEEELRCDYKYYYKYVEHLIDEAKKSKFLNDYFYKNKIQVNDFLILTLLQHFGAPSPLLDFSHNPKIALYFAFNECKKNKIEGNNVIDNYVSFYRIDLYKVQMEICSIQNSIVNDVYNAEILAQEFCKESGVILHTSNVKKSFKNLPYEEFCDNTPIFILGGELGKRTIISNVLNLKCTYNFTNIRIKSQEGSFILNTSGCKPLAEEIICRYRESKPILIECININKGLKEYIKNNYLNNINDNVIYPKDADSQYIIATLEDIGLLERKRGNQFYSFLKMNENEARDFLHNFENKRQSLRNHLISFKLDKCVNEQMIKNFFMAVFYFCNESNAPIFKKILKNSLKLVNFKNLKGGLSKDVYNLLKQKLLESNCNLTLWNQLLASIYSSETITSNGDKMVPYKSIWSNEEIEALACLNCTNYLKNPSPNIIDITNTKSGLHKFVKEACVICCCDNNHKIRKSLIFNSLLEYFSSHKGLKNEKIEFMKIESDEFPPNSIESLFGNKQMYDEFVKECFPQDK